MLAQARIGDLLVEQGALTRAQLEAVARRFHGHIGQALCAAGIIDGRAVAQAVARQQGLDQADLHSHPPDLSLFTPRDLSHYIAHHYVPYARVGQEILLATSDPSPALRQFAERHYHCRVRFVVITRRDVKDYLAARGATTSTRNACLGLRRRYRHLVADRIMMAHQMRGLALVAILLVAVAISAPTATWYALLILCNLFYAATLLIKMEFYRQGSAAQRELARFEPVLGQQAESLQDDDLPVYSILVPMYCEGSAVIQRQLASLNALDYPKEKLDIKLICEADDTATLAALKALHPPSTMEIITVTPSYPRTKPKACNIALERVRGEFVVIYDAEDAPAPDQLRLAVAMFRAGPKNLACLQAALNYYNRDENTLTQMFSIEYSALFRLLLPGLERMGLPIPLGGTSNHLKTQCLRDAGGWDAFNVTEDADLGVRLSYLGYTIRSLPSLTLEEAPITFYAWFKQRSRWIKGYIQTWLVYTRDPRELKRRLGRTGYYGFHFFIGAPAVTFLLAPLFWVVFAFSLIGVFPTALSTTMQVLCAFSFVGGVLSHWLFARKVMEIEGWEYLGRAFLLYPFYWLLHSIAAARALWQLATAPHYWDKTRHGVSRQIVGLGSGG